MKAPPWSSANTYRWRGHFEGDACTYREPGELDEWVKKDPIPRFAKKMLDDKILSQKELDQLHADIDTELEEAIAFAEKSPFPEPADMFEDIYA